MGRGRYHPQTSYGHRIVLGPWGDYTLSWVVDRYYEGHRCRFPKTYRRSTDEAGARRFAKRWGVPMPDQRKERAT